MRIVRRCKRNKFQGFENSGAATAGNSQGSVALSGGDFRSPLLTYVICGGSKPFGPHAASFWAPRDSPFLKRSEQSRCPKQDPRTCTSCSKTRQATRPGLPRRNHRKISSVFLRIELHGTRADFRTGFVQFARLIFGLNLHFCARFR
jgi:hypothetical protein